MAERGFISPSYISNLCVLSEGLAYFLSTLFGTIKKPFGLSEGWENHIPASLLPFRLIGYIGDLLRLYLRRMPSRGWTVFLHSFIQD
jgi:hypothetical protein